MTSGSILVGVDDSVPSRAAIRWALERARVADMRVVLAHALEDEWDATDKLVMLENREAAEALLVAQVAYATSIDDSIPVTTLLLEGDPLTELADASANAEMLVVGTHKTGFIHGTVFGSKLLALASIANCPVAFIPNLAGKARHGVVASAEDTPTGQTTVRFAAAEAGMSSQQLTLVLAAPPTNATIDRRLSDVLELARSADDSLRVRARLSARGMAEALIDASAAAALLVVGQPRTRPPGVTSLSRVAHDVLLNIASPTIVVFEDPPPLAAVV